MKTTTLVEALLLINKHRKLGTFTTEQAFEMANLFTDAYEEEQHEQVQETSR